MLSGPTAASQDSVIWGQWYVGLCIRAEDAASCCQVYAVVSFRILQQAGRCQYHAHRFKGADGAPS